MRILMLASIQVVEVDTKDWKGNRLLDLLEEGEIKQMVHSRMVAEVLKAQVGVQNRLKQKSARGDHEALTVKNLRKEVEKIHQRGKDYEFEDHNDDDQNAEATEDPSDEIVEENLPETSTWLVEEEEGVKGVVECGGDKLLQLLAEVEEAAEEVAF